MNHPPVRSQTAGQTNNLKLPDLDVPEPDCMAVVLKPDTALFGHTGQIGIKTGKPAARDHRVPFARTSGILRIGRKQVVKA